jgi:hypothetical protein
VGIAGLDANAGRDITVTDIDHHRWWTAGGLLAPNYVVVVLLNAFWWRIGTVGIRCHHSQRGRGEPYGEDGHDCNAGFREASTQTSHERSPLAAASRAASSGQESLRSARYQRLARDARIERKALALR